MKRKPKREKLKMRDFTPGEYAWLDLGDAFQARAASLRPQPASRFSRSGIAIAGGVK